MSSLPERTEASRFPLELTRVALLLSLSVFMNYADRGSLSIAAPGANTLSA